MRLGSVRDIDMFVPTSPVKAASPREGYSPQAARKGLSRISLGLSLSPERGAAGTKADTVDQGSGAKQRVQAERGGGEPGVDGADAANSSIRVSVKLPAGPSKPRPWTAEQEQGTANDSAAFVDSEADGSQGAGHSAEERQELEDGGEEGEKGKGGGGGCEGCCEGGGSEGERRNDGGGDVGSPTQKTQPTSMRQSLSVPRISFGALEAFTSVEEGLQVLCTF